MACFEVVPSDFIIRTAELQSGRVLDREAHEKEAGI
jgi:hypothetical protein